LPRFSGGVFSGGVTRGLRKTLSSGCAAGNMAGDYRYLEQPFHIAFAMDDADDPKRL
jgi:hypothetical protein